MDSEMNGNDRNPLRALNRLRQLSIEIEQGLQRDDLELVCQAAGLLGPTLTQWNNAHETLDISAGEAAQLALETRQTLTRCEASILKTMGRMSGELKSLRQGRQHLQTKRRPRYSASRRLDDLLG